MGQILAKKEDFRAFARALTTLAEVVLNTAYRICDAELQPRYGRPRLDSGAPCEFCICALGKCGGRELGWASDIELLFVYTGQGMTDGPNPVHNSQYYERLVRMICDTIVARREGIFEIDLRLRPYGDKGALASSLDNFHEYFNEKGGALPYERQALIKLRAIGGEPGLRKQVEAARSAFVFSREPLDLNMLTHIRERQNNELVKSGTINVKYSYGGVIDIEYYVQQLQILHGVDDPALRSPNTIDALVALHQAGHIPDEDYNRLSEAYIFLRRLINALRIVRGHAKDLILPDRHSQPFLFLARRLGYADDPKHDAGEQLRQDVRRYMEWASQAHRTRFIHKLFD
jgi:glutamate-ammonia-ligase adenylyltransferase